MDFSVLVPCRDRPRITLQITLDEVTDLGLVLNSCCLMPGPEELIQRTPFPRHARAHGRPVCPLPLERPRVGSVTRAGGWQEGGKGKTFY